MTDAIFDIKGDTLPLDYPFALWESLVRHVPILESDQTVGIIPLRTMTSAEGMLLPKRAKLTLRLPRALTPYASSLSGLHIDIEGGALQIGSLKFRDLQAYPTLHAHLVNTDDDEVSFLNGVSARLAELNINAKLICGMRNHITSTARTISGFSLVIHDLKPDASLRLQYTGLGADRQYGCGIFVPYKVISDLD
jgi:CRISPR-associated protein Cas6